MKKDSKADLEELLENSDYFKRHNLPQTKAFLESFSLPYHVLTQIMQEDISLKKAIGLHYRDDFLTLLQIDKHPSILNQYSRKFSGSDVKKLIDHDIQDNPANHMIQYLSSVDRVIEEYGSRIKPIFAEHKRFSQDELALFHNQWIDPDIAAQYSESFMCHEIVSLIQGRVPPAIANMYNQTLLGEKIAALHVLCVEPWQTVGYLQEADDLFYVASEGVPKTYANALVEKFSGLQISYFHRHKIALQRALKTKLSANALLLSHWYGVSEEKILSYGGDDAIATYFAKFDLTQQQAETFALRIKNAEHGIIDFIQTFSADELESYPARFSVGELIKLKKAGVSGVQACAYSIKADADSIIALHKVDMPLSRKNKLLEFFTGGEIQRLADIDDDVIFSFNTRFNGYDISKLVREGISMDFINKCPSDFNSNDIVYLPKIIKKQGCTFEEAVELHRDLNKGSDKKIKEIGLQRAQHLLKIRGKHIDLHILSTYPDYFHEQSIWDAYSKGISGEQIAAYGKQRFMSDILFYVEHGIEPSYVDKFPRGTSEKSILVFKKLGLDPSRFNSFVLQNHLENARGIVCSKDIDLDSLVLLGYGANALIIDMGDRARKFQRDPYVRDRNFTWDYLRRNARLDYPTRSTREFAFFSKVDSPYVMKVYRQASTKDSDSISLLDRFFVEIEKIQGKDLTHYQFNEEKTMQIGEQILQGLIDLRLHGIYHHRDIRPQNIMYDEKNDRAVIIDLGIATEHRNYDNYMNRRYGGPSDLTSLAQVLYKLTTGEHLFTKSSTMELTAFAGDLKDQREKAFANPTRLHYYKQKIRESIGNQQLQEFLVTCLDARPYHLGKVRRLLKDM